MLIRLRILQNNTFKNITGYVGDVARCSVERKQNLHFCSNYLNNGNKINASIQLSNCTALPSRSFCTQTVPKDVKVFGDFKTHQPVEMDAEEMEEEEFTNNEVCIPRRLKPSAGQYAKMVKDYVNKGDVQSALNVLDLIKKNRDKPSVHIYNLIIRAYAVQGNIKKCFHLYNKLKQRGLKPDAAMYTSLFNACANTKDKQLALEHLTNLRQHLYETGFPLKDTHYHVMIKAYGMHNKILEAFQLVDEMRDKRLPITTMTYQHLLIAAISDKEAGLRHAIIVFHLMRIRKIQPNYYTYSLLLQAMKETKLGNLNVNDVLISGVDSTKVHLAEGERPDLLATPPALSTLLISAGKDVARLSPPVKNSSELSPNILNDILAKNPLLLFGGYEGILSRMEKDNAVPDVKIMTTILLLLPDSETSENNLIEYARMKNITLDIDFYNMLIKKRSLRNGMSESTKEILYEMQKKNLRPNITTFGVLAIGCKTASEGRELIEGMEAAGYAPNVVIVTQLIMNASWNADFKYLKELMDYLYIRRIKVDDKLYQALDTFVRQMKRARENKERYRFARGAAFKRNLDDFVLDYEKWQQKMRRRQ